jgi:hypothetical protein
MLCPKCDYISFDHLETCAKCKHSLIETASLLGGTSVNAARVNYLEMVMETGQEKDVFETADLDSGVVDDGEASDTGLEYGVNFDNYEEPSASPSLPDYENELETESDGGSVVLEVPDLGGIEFNGVVSDRTQEQPRAEDQFEGGLEAGDSEELIVEGADKKGQEVHLLEELELDLEESEALPSEEIDSAELSLDASALTLESNDGEQEEVVETEGSMTTAPSDTDASGQTGIDLGDIDLSDLVHAVGDEHESPQGEILEHRDLNEENKLDSFPEDELLLDMESDDDLTETNDLKISSPSGLDNELESVEGPPSEGPEDIAATSLVVADSDAVSTGDDTDFIDLSVGDDAEVFDNGLDFSVDSPDGEMIDLSMEMDDDK